MRRVAFLLLALACALWLAACGGSNGGEGKKQASSDGPPGGCERVSAAAPKTEAQLPEPALELDPAKTYRATVETSCGTFVITLDPKRAPVTGGSFVSLARKGFYDGLAFHRIAPGFVIQGGDPAGDGSGGPGYSVRERPPAGIAYSRGTVAMAKAGTEPPGTSGSQFFVVTGPDAGLPPDYALLGQVTGGDAVLTRIEALGASQDGPPSRPVVIDKITVTES